MSHASQHPAAAAQSSTLAGVRVQAPLLTSEHAQQAKADGKVAQQVELAAQLLQGGVRSKECSVTQWATHAPAPPGLLWLASCHHGCPHQEQQLERTCL